MSALPPLPPLEPQDPGTYSAPLNYATPMPARADLREIAVRQKAIQFCILGYIGFAILAFTLPQPLKAIAGLGIIASAITGAVFVFMLAIAVYSSGLGIVLGILSLIPFLGVIVLLIVNGKATSVLRQHGVHVGLLGARMRDLGA